MTRIGRGLFRWRGVVSALVLLPVCTVAVFSPPWVGEDAWYGVLGDFVLGSYGPVDDADAAIQPNPLEATAHRRSACQPAHALDEQMDHASPRLSNMNELSLKRHTAESSRRSSSVANCTDRDLRRQARRSRGTLTHRGEEVQHMTSAKPTWLILPTETPNLGAKTLWSIEW